MRTVAPVSPGEMLDEEFLKLLGLTKYRLAKDIGVPAQRIGNIVAGKRCTRISLRNRTVPISCPMNSWNSGSWRLRTHT